MIMFDDDDDAFVAYVCDVLSSEQHTSSYLQHRNS